MRIRGLAVVLCTVLVACSSGDDPEPRPITADDAPPPVEEPAPEPEPEPEPDPAETADEDDWTVPDEADLDAAYAQRVIDELHRLEGEAFRLVQREGFEEGDPLPFEAVELIGAATVEDRYLQGSLDRLEEAVARDFEGSFDPFADRPFTVESVVVARADCLILAGSLDLTRMSEEPAIEVVDFNYALHRRDPAPPNPTGWGIFRATALVGEETPYTEDEVCP